MVVPVKGAGEAAERDLKQVDGYLTAWDSFARGESQLGPLLKKDKAGFEAALTRLLQATDDRAPGRLVFYAVVQVGGFIPLDSELGKAAAEFLGSDFPIRTPKQAGPALFAGDLYFWWQDNRRSFKDYPLLDEWARRDFAQKTVIPFYERLATKRK